MRPAFECRRPAVSQITMSKPSSTPRLIASKITLDGSPSGLPLTTGTPARLPHSSSCSVAAARNVSPAARRTFLPSSASFFASLPIVVVLPTPLTPSTSSTNGFFDAEVERRRVDGEDLARGLADLFPDLVRLLELVLRQPGLDRLEDPVGGARADVGGEQHLLELVDGLRRRSSSCRTACRAERRSRRGSSRARLVGSRRLRIGGRCGLLCLLLGRSFDLVVVVLCFFGLSAFFGSGFAAPGRGRLRSRLGTTGASSRSRRSRALSGAFSLLFAEARRSTSMIRTITTAAMPTSSSSWTSGEIYPSWRRWRVRGSRDRRGFDACGSTVFGREARREIDLFDEVGELGERGARPLASGRGRRSGAATRCPTAATRAGPARRPGDRAGTRARGPARDRRGRRAARRDAGIVTTNRSVT